MGRTAFLGLVTVIILILPTASCTLNYEVTIKIEPEGSGTAIGSGSYTKGSEVTVKAEPAEGFLFKGWIYKENVVETKHSYRFNITGNTELVASFEPRAYQIETRSIPKEGGITSGGGIYKHGEEVVIEAKPGENYLFVNWIIDGKEVSTDKIYQFKALSNINAIARFEIAKLMSTQMYDSISKDIDNYKLTVKYERDKAADIYLLNKITGEEEKLLTVNDAYTGHYNFEESHNGNVYLIRRKGDTNADNWVDELWKYSLDNKVTKLFSTKGLDFRVSPNEEFIAIENRKIIITDSEGKIIKEFTDKDLNIEITKHAFPELYKWSDDNQLFWGFYMETAWPVMAYSINLESWEIVNYNLMDLSIGDEFNLNPNTGIIAFSDYPVTFDIDDAEEFKESKKEVKLYLYNLNNKELKTIDTSITKEFNPKWIDNTTLEYDDPGGNGRVTYKLD